MNPHARAARTPVERSEQASWSGDVARALEQLDEVDATVVRLVYFDGLRPRQVARRLTLPEPKVLACLSRGLRQLGDYLTRGGPGAVGDGSR